MSFPAQSQLKYLVLSILFIVATVSFVRTTLDIMQSSKRLDDLKVSVNNLEQNKSRLEGAIQYKKTPEYIEEQARNSLGLVKPNEQVFVAPAVLGETTAKVQTRVAQNKSNPQLWFELFF